MPYIELCTHCAQVFIIGLLAVEKYENFRPVLDTYCDKLFHASTVHTYVDLILVSSIVSGPCSVVIVGQAPGIQDEECV